MTSVAIAVAGWPQSAGAQSPDLIVDATRLESSADFKAVNFRSSDCAVAEECVDGTGKRLLLRFDMAVANIGSADLVLGRPRTTRPCSPSASVTATIISMVSAPTN